MKAIRFYKANDLRLEEIPDPIPEKNQVFLQIACVGICGSDVHTFKEGGIGGTKPNHPLILGHEFSAYIINGPQKGQLVAVDPARPCQFCEYCLEGNPNFCLNLRFAGSDDTDGGLQQFLNWPKEAIYSLPATFTKEEGAMLEPLGVAIHALKLGKVFPGMSVGVFGAGPIGLLTIQMAKLAGAARIFATDKLTHRLERALDCGATDIFLADNTESSAILSATHHTGLDVTFEAAGDDGAAVETAIQTAKPGATTVLLGIPTEDITLFTASAARRRGLTIKLARRMKNTYPSAIRLVNQGLIDLKCLISDSYPPKEYLKAFENATNRTAIKYFIDFSL